MAKAVQFIELIGPDFSEDLIWKERVRPLLDGWPENIVNICAYGFTEMMNNANDHSGAEYVSVILELDESTFTIHVIDLGVGIFENLVAKLGLDDIRHAVFELTKGKVTTDRTRHTGEGIFFTSRMFDRFSIGSSSLFLGRMTDRDWLLENEKDPNHPRGTSVKLVINRNSTRTCKDVFEHYASEQDDFAFNRTTIAVALAHEGDTLISRSQAKRVVARLEKFREVVLDFEGIKSIAPAFADEIFRVFSTANPKVKIFAINTNEDIDRMIRKAKADTESAT